jgi:signal transduction histidine kinase/CheY-like chemotaxis protein
MREAERKQQTVWGLELGTKGTLTLRLVRPVFSEGAVAGYVELGKEIEPFLYERKRHSGAHMAVSLHKDTIDRSEWEKSMRAGGRKPFWERYPADVVAYSTSDDLPDLSLFYEPSGVYASTRNGLGETRVRDAAGKLWRASATPLYDASKKDIGDVIVLSEVTASEVSTFRSFAICGAAIVSLLSAFLGYFFVMLRGLDEGIRRQHDALREQSNALTEANDRLSKTVKHAHELADEAARANQAKSRFLANMSHEIRTPLNAIIGFSNVLKGRELSAAHREFLDIIVSSGKLLLSLINDILDLSKIEAGKIVFESLDIDLRRLVSEVVSVVALKTDPTAVRVRTDIDPVVPNALKGDPTRIKQVLLNLGGNAAKFTSSGEIVVSVAYVSASDDAVVLRFSVKDSGIGIPAERVGAIFEVFEQADSSVTRKFGGSGLGLAISRSLVRLMGGELSVVSEAGKGSDFFFTLSLPLGHRGDAVQTLPQAQASRRLDGTRFLVAEDVLTNRQLIDVILSGWGATMTFVENGQEALSALRHGGYDLCLMDVQMPVMSGLQAAIAARGEGITVPIIALTASASVESSTECRDAGMDAFVPKPIDEDDLWRTIQRVLRR